MLKSSYHHRLLKLMSPDVLVRQVMMAYHNGEVMQDPSHPGIVLVTKKCTDVTPFAHPLYIKGAVAIDVRTITTLSPEGALQTRQKDELDFLILRARLELAWLDEEKGPTFTTLSQIAGKFYSAYIADTLSKMFTLRADKQTIIHVLAAYYHWCQYREEISDVTEFLPNILKYIRIATGLPLEYIEPIMNSVIGKTTHSIIDIEHFIGLLHNLPELDGLLPGLSVRTISIATMHNWRGGHSSEVVALSLEYPPCFIAMLLAANEYRAFKSTPLELIIKRNRKVDLGQYAKTVNGLISD